MTNINTHDVLETIKMIEEEHLDIRTITMGISLRDLASDDIGVLSDKVYDKITRRAEKLVSTGEQIERELGIPIINKRISVTPIAMIGAVTNATSYVPLAKALDRAAHSTGVNFVGGFSALVQKGFAKGDEILIHSIPEALAETELVCSSVNVASTKAGVNLDAIELMGRIIKQTAELTRDNESMGCSKLVVFANAVDDNPFMAGAFHGIGEPETVINVGVSGPGVVQSAIRRAGDCSINEVAEVIKKTAFKITRMGQLVGSLASSRLGVPFGIVDLSLAPTPAIGDSVARILEEVGLDVCGCCGTTAILAMLNDAVKKGGVMASSSVGGLSGAFIPVSEDEGMIAAAQAGALSLEKLEAMTAVCSVGIDMVAVPGDTTAEVLSGLIADEIAIGVVNSKTTAVRVIPAIGKKVGDMVEFGGLLGSAPIMPISTGSPAKFIHRGGRIPAPIQSLKN
ncbi:PFL family protein [Agathobaculum sp. NTUH-O15-33]|uniref:PFL family protein n=1 Tax=Agathobaculum sp. NTUH-O15-33 TaxID=3079302 RepID=UPI002958AC0E|nr:PFL family protein [Agathobaculum sp. NTUH-O15-33]WNX86385.1 PFL family protein [Agathobaculum sp. NTUH-O15-33]